MENRKNLHAYGLVMIILGVLNLFLFGATVVSGLVDGSVANILADVEADILGIVKLVLGIIAVIMLLLVAADVLLGVKALKVSKNPSADKGYITVAKVFLVLCVIATISHVATLVGGKAPVVDSVVNLADSLLNVCIYVSFIQAATAVRKDVLIEKN